MGKMIDYRGGKGGRWGHALHPSTISVFKPRGWLLTLISWVKGYHFFTVFCHCSEIPEDGDVLAWTAFGDDAFGLITDVEHVRNVRDMFKLSVRVNGGMTKP